MEPDLKIIIGLLSLVCLMWAGGIWFICSFYKCDHDCIYCGDSAEDCPFCRKGDDTLPGEEMDRIAEEMKIGQSPFRTHVVTSPGDTFPSRTIKREIESEKTEL